MRVVASVVAVAMVVVLFVAGAGCEQTTDPGPRDAGGTEASSEIPDASSMGITFDPGLFPTECGQDSDCVLVSAITECTTCCPTSAVNREPGEKRYGEVVGACGGELSKCKRVCEPLIAHCDEKRCVAR